MNAMKLAEIKERAEKATDGPWKWDVDYFSCEELISENGDNVLYAGSSQNSGYVVTGVDAQFIAHARQDVPELVVEVERLQKGREISHEQIRQLFGEIARLKRVVEFIEQHADDADIVRYFVKEALGIDD